MFTSSITKLQSVCLHHIGSKSKNEGVVLSESPLSLDAATVHNLMTYCFSSFKEAECFNFYNDLGLDYNEVYGCVKSIFNTPKSFSEQARNIARFLYEKSDHPNIKSGDLIVVLFSDCDIDGILVDAVGLFKSEGNTDFLSLSCDKSGASISTLSGVDLKYVDKAALIFNVNADSGFAVAVIDNVNRKNEAKYWIEDFLHIEKTTNEYLQTASVLSAAKEFISKQMPQKFNVSKAEQALLIHRSIEYFKNNESFELSGFNETVLGDEITGESFCHFFNTFFISNGINPSDSFQISEAAVRKQSRAIRSVIKLDKNFHVYIHGGDRLIKRGYDEETGMHYYQLFFDEES